MNVPSLRINELFMSIEGEGIYAGVPTLFIRTQGCSIHCKYCDSKNTWDKNGGEEFPLSNIVLNTLTPTFISNPSIKRISITGGNPMEQFQSVLWLVDQIKGCWLNKEVHLEHPGIFINGLKTEMIILNKLDSICFDIKSPSSMNKTDADILAMSNVSVLNTALLLLKKNISVQIKGVVSSFEDLDFYINCIKMYPTLSNFNFILSPMFTNDNKLGIDEELINRMILELGIGTFGRNGRLSIQIHKILNAK